MSPLCKLMWMKDNLPEVFNKAHKFISIKEYMFFHFFGEFMIDHSVASSTGLFDIYDLDWNTDALKLQALQRKIIEDWLKQLMLLQGCRPRMQRCSASAVIRHL